MFKELTPVYAFEFDDSYSRDQAEFERKKQLESYVIALVKNTPHEKYLMEQTGFNVPGNIALLADAIASNSLEEYLSDTDRNFNEYIKEFFLRLPVLPYNLSLQEVESVPRLCVDDQTGNKVALCSLINMNEREGSVYRRTKLLESLLSQASPNSMFVTTSPAGPHGMNDRYMEQGYLESQTGIYMISEEGLLNVVTIRTSMDLEQNEKLLQRLSQGTYIPKAADDWTRIVDVVDTVVQSTKNEPTEIVKIMESIIGTETAWIDKSKLGHVLQNVSFEQIYHQMNNLNNLEVECLLSLASPEIENYKNFIRNTVFQNSPEELTAAVVKLGDTLGKLSFILRKSALGNSEIKTASSYNFDGELTYQQSLGGCSETVFSEYGVRAVGSELGIDYPFNIQGRCRSKDLCLSGSSGNEKWLAACHFCLNCDIGIRTGKLRVADILSQTEENLNFNLNSEKHEAVSTKGAIVESVGSVIVSIFKN